MIGTKFFDPDQRVFLALSFGIKLMKDANVARIVATPETANERITGSRLALGID